MHTVESSEPDVCQSSQVYPSVQTQYKCYLVDPPHLCIDYTGFEQLAEELIKEIWFVLQLRRDDSTSTKWLMGTKFVDCLLYFGQCDNAPR